MLDRMCERAMCYTPATRDILIPRHLCRGPGGNQEGMRTMIKQLYLCDPQRYPMWAIEEISSETNTITYRELRSDSGVMKGSIGVLTRDELSEMTAQGYYIITDIFPGSPSKQ